MSRATVTGRSWPGPRATVAGSPGRSVCSIRARANSALGGPTMRLLALLLVAGLLVSGSPPPAQAAEPPFHELWRTDRSTGFDGWSLYGVRVADGRLVLDPTSPASGGDTLGLTVPTGSAGMAVGPVRETSGPFQELIASWNA